MDKKLTKVDIVYNYLLQEMAKLNYRSGDHLVISKIAKICEVSDIPVREALRRLQSDGYIRIIPHQGAIVLGFEKNAIIDIVQIKGILEGYATRLSIDYLSPKDLEELRKINLQMKKSEESGDVQTYSDLNKKFHMTIYSAVPQKGLVDMISDLWNKWHVTKCIFSMSPEMMNRSYLEHERILELIESHQYDQVEQYVRGHKLKAITSWALLGRNSIL